MEYLPLALKYRPQTFDEIAGQDQITKALKNSLEQNKIAKGYLFCGPRGTAKTSAARIFAKALNCLSKDHPVPEPCGICEACIAIKASEFLDVVEIDAASSGKIDDIRRLIDSVAYPPMTGRWKVYIIDEAHQLSRDAKDAILKTLEEPPPQVMFILATTEYAKMPPTISSRCQVFRFLPGDEEVISRQLKVIAEGEGFQIDEASRMLIARRSQGSYREAVALLERCVSHGGKVLNESSVAEAIGIPESGMITAIFEGIRSQDRVRMLEIARQAIREGLDGYSVAGQVKEIVRQLIVHKIRPEYNAPEEISLLAAKFDYETLQQIMKAVSNFKTRIAEGGYEQVELEMGLLDLVDVVQPLKKLPSGTQTFHVDLASIEKKALEEFSQEEKTIIVKDPNPKGFLGGVVNDLMRITIDYPDYITPTQMANIVSKYIEETKGNIPETDDGIWTKGLRQRALNLARSLCNDCTKCALSKNRIPKRGSVFGEGPLNPLIMCVGEAPARNFEARTMLPMVDGDALRMSGCSKCKNFEVCFVADQTSEGPWARTPNRECDYQPETPSEEVLALRRAPRKDNLHTAGAILGEALKTAGVRRSSRVAWLRGLAAAGKNVPAEMMEKPEIYITNAVRCPSLDDTGKNTPPSPEEIDACRPWLDITERIIQPKTVVTLGVTAMASLGLEIEKDFKITQADPVTPRPRSWGEVPEAYVNVHPSYILRKEDEETIKTLTGRLVDTFVTAKEKALGN